MEQQEKRFYVVRGRARHGTITYKCRTAASALDTLQRFKHERHDEIAIQAPDGTPLTEAGLEALAGDASHVENAASGVQA